MIMKSPVRSLAYSMKLAKMAPKPPIMHHLHQFLQKFRSILLDLIKKLFTKVEDDYHKRIARNSVYSSLRWRHYWCSNHVRPLPEPIVIVLDDEEDEAMEEMVAESDQEECHSEVGTPPWCSSHSFDKRQSIDEINRLAESFIANGHEKFRIEKEESFRLYQEMLARGI